MVQICKTVLDCHGGIVARGTLPMAFTSRADAAAFMHQYLAVVFEHGRRGYREEGKYWWGCDETAVVELHCYSIMN